MNKLERSAAKPSLRSTFKRRRCLVLADSFFEWQATGKRCSPCANAGPSRLPACGSAVVVHLVFATLLAKAPRWEGTLSQTRVLAENAILADAEQAGSLGTAHS
jgi:hypothetical protein